MQKKYLYIVLIFTITFLYFSTLNSAVSEKFDPKSKKGLIEKLGNGWDEAITNQDISIISKLYATDAKYFPTNENVLNGNKEITNYWKSILKFMVGIKLNLKDLKGTKEVLVESGDGVAVFYVSETKKDTTFFNYVNVWQLQYDGNYKVLIDIYKDNVTLKNK